MVTKSDQTYSFSFTQSKLDKIYWQATTNDTRQLVSSTSSLPYNAIGLLKITYSLNVVSYRTGVLIAPNIVLTAGHNLYDSRKNPNDSSKKLGKALDISFYPGLSNNTSRYNECKFSSYYYPPDFETDGKEDYGVIVLKEKVGDSTGWIELKVFDKALTEEQDSIEIAGYPLNKTNQTNDIFSLYKAKGSILKVNKKTGMITTNIKSSYGQSGSGLLYHDTISNKWSVIGVHVASSFFDDAFYSTMITKQRFDQIEKWIKSSQVSL